MSGSRVPLPADAQRPFQVFVNGVEQREGADFEVVAGQLVFGRDLKPPRPDTVRTYARLMFWGRYGKEDVVDVAYQVGGQARVASRLPVSPYIRS